MKQYSFASCLLAIVATLATLAVAVAAQSQNTSAAPNQQDAKSKANTHASPRPQDDGQQVFQQNCSRCHTAPDGFSPRIAGTVVRHMRVRASLSEHDERAILHFLNP